MKKPVHIGLDFARPGSDYGVLTVHGGRQCGKTAAIKQTIEAALNAGCAIYISATGELRGAPFAKDVTPATSGNDHPASQLPQLAAPPTKACYRKG